MLFILSISIGINLFLLVLLLLQRAHRKCQPFFGRYPIKTVSMQEFDSVFKNQGKAFGPGLASEVFYIGQGDKSARVLGGPSETEVWILSALAKKSRKIFEFGTCTGKTTYLMAKNSPEDAEVYTLTLHPDQLKEYMGTAKDTDKAKKAALNESRFERFFYDDTEVKEKITQIFSDSMAFNEAPYEGQFDLVFIDGSHAYSYVKSDTEKALKMLKPGGMILWHDYSSTHWRKRDVYRFLNEMAESSPLVHIANTNLVAYKR